LEANRRSDNVPQGKAKYSAWQKVVDAKTTPDQADKKYVEAVNKLKTKYGTQ